MWTLPSGPVAVYISRAGFSAMTWVPLNVTAYEVAAFTTSEASVTKAGVAVRLLEGITKRPVLPPGPVEVAVYGIQNAAEVPPLLLELPPDELEEPELPEEEPDEELPDELDDVLP